MHGIDLWRGQAEWLLPAVLRMYSTLSVSIPLKPRQACLITCLSPDLVQDGSISGQNYVVLNESHTDPSWRPQLFLCSFKPVTLQLKVTLNGSTHSTCRQVKLPVINKILHEYFHNGHPYVMFSKHAKQYTGLHQNSDLTLFSKCIWM